MDINEKDLNLCVEKAAAAITNKPAIMPVHYAGIMIWMLFKLVAERHSILVIEDAAQGLCAGYRGQHLGNIGDLGAISFPETKNISGGEAGALVVNDLMLEKAEIIRKKVQIEVSF